jgi:cytochrome c-type biogenesis protein CcmH/NrfG
MAMDVNDAGPGDTASALPADHRVAKIGPLPGIVDTAAAARSIRALERARRANPGNIRVILNVGDAYLTAQRYDAAADAYRDALAASPGHPNATVGLAMVRHARGDDAAAIRLIERVLAAFPDHQLAQYDLALVRFARQELTAAREAWVRAAEIDPTSRLGQMSQDFVELLSDGRDSAP